MTVEDVNLNDREEYIVVGPPGTGKTTWLARQANRAAEKWGGENIAVVSLTRAAAAEVAGRKTAIPQQNIGTLHAHAFRALKKPPLAEVPEGVKLWNEVCGTSSWKLTGTSPDTDVDLVRMGEDGDKLLAKANVLRARGTDPRLWAPNVGAFYRAWCDWKAEAGRYDFQDLIERAADEVLNLPWAPLVMMVDEAQDMSAGEMRLIRAWAYHCKTLIVVGDPDQALYTWRGADPKAVFGDDPAAVRVLAQSYRVPAKVHAEAVRMIRRIPERLDVEYRPRVVEAAGLTTPVEGDVETLSISLHDPDPVVTTIRRELEQDRTVMVLTSCGYMLTPLTRRMKELGLPFHNPYRVTQGAWNPLGGVRRLMAFLRPDPATWGEEQRMWSWEDLRLWIEPLQAKDVLIRGAKTKVQQRAEAYKTAGEDEIGKAELPELHEVLALFHPVHHEAVVMLDVDWWKRNLKAADQKRLSFGVEVLQQHGPAALREEPKLIVGTIHSVKGAEADTVILFPDLSNAGYYQGLHRRGEPHDSIMRLFYVGMTRAKEKLVLGRASSTEAVTW